MNDFALSNKGCRFSTRGIWNWAVATAGSARRSEVEKRMAVVGWVDWKRIYRGMYCMCGKPTTKCTYFTVIQSMRSGSRMGTDGGLVRSVSWCKMFKVALD